MPLTKIAAPEAGAAGRVKTALVPLTSPLGTTPQAKVDPPEGEGATLIVGGFPGTAGGVTIRPEPAIKQETLFACKQ